MYVLLTLAVMVACDKKGNEAVDCSTMNHEGVELVYPKGTESFKVGSTVPVKWKVDPDKVNLVDITVSTTSPDGPFRRIFSKSISVPYEGGVQCMDTVWTIGSEHETVQYSPPQTVYIRVEKYSAANEYSDVSGMITINE